MSKHTVLAEGKSTDGYSNYRLVRLNKDAAQVEIERSPNDWHWCVWRSLPLEAATDLFQSQTGYQVAA